MSRRRTYKGLAEGRRGHYTCANCKKRCEVLGKTGSPPLRCTTCAEEREREQSRLARRLANPGSFICVDCGLPKSFNSRLAENGVRCRKCRQHRNNQRTKKARHIPVARKPLLRRTFYCRCCGVKFEDNEKVRKHCSIPCVHNNPIPSLLKNRHRPELLLLCEEVAQYQEAINQATSQLKERTA